MGMATYRFMENGFEFTGTKKELKEWANGIRRNNLGGMTVREYARIFQNGDDNARRA